MSVSLDLLYGMLGAAMMLLATAILMALITTAATDAPTPLTVWAGSSDFSRKLCRAREANLY